MARRRFARRRRYFLAPYMVYKKRGHDTTDKETVRFLDRTVSRVYHTNPSTFFPHGPSPLWVNPTVTVTGGEQVWESPETDIMVNLCEIEYVNSPMDWRENPCWHRKRQEGKDIKPLSFALKSETVTTWTHPMWFPPMTTCDMQTSTTREIEYEWSPSVTDCRTLIADERHVSEVAAKSIVDTLDRKAYRKMVPSMETGFSLPLFLWETGTSIGMVKSLFTRLWRLITLRAQRPRIKFPDGTSRVATIDDIIAAWNDIRSQPIKKLADGWLEATYGWFPFVSDIIKIIRIYREVGEKAEAFVANAGKEMTLHYTCEVPFPGLEYADGEATVAETNWFDHVPHATGISSLRVKWRNAKTLSALKYCATMRFRYYIPSYSLPGATQFLAELDAWGLNRGLYTRDLWAALPFSFVVDWFLGLDKWIADHADPRLLPVHVTIKHFSRSLKWKEKKELAALDGELILPGGVQLNLEDPSTPYTITTDYYWRDPGEPDLKSEVDRGLLSLPSGWQVVSGLSLILQRL